MWIYNLELNDEFLEKYQGFVYIITNLKDKRQYIGKKNIWTFKIRMKNKKKKREKIQSDWKEYFGSNQELLNDIEKIGKENFKREILEFCKTKGELGYKEIVHQIDKRVLEYPNLYYNSYIGGRFNRKHIKSLWKD